MFCLDNCQYLIYLTPWLNSSSQSQVERAGENERENEGAAVPRAGGTSSSTGQHPVVDLAMEVCLETGSDEGLYSEGLQISFKGLVIQHVLGLVINVNVQFSGVVLSI